MITTASLHVTTAKGDGLYLGPFDAPELEAVWPFDLENLIFPHDQLVALNFFSPEEIIEVQRRPDAQHYTEWGVYQGGMATQNFLGTVSLTKAYRAKGDQGPYMPEVLEVGTHLMRPEARGNNNT